MHLKLKDKVRLKGTNETGEIIKVIDEFRAIVDTFDGEVKVNNHQVEPFVAGDAQKKLENIYYFEAPKEKFEKPQPKDSTFAETTKEKFSYELDLHIEKLVDNPGRLDRQAIIGIQISRLKTYLQEAIEKKIQRVYIIHGIGSGRLKMEVEKVLSQTDEVRSFNNNHHPKYGKGSTEVHF